MGAVDAGPTQIQLLEGTAFEVCRGCAAGHKPSHRTPEIGYGKKVSRRPSLQRLQEEICLVESQRDMERAEACRVFVLERVVSCRRFDPRWRTKLDFGSGESFDDLHWSTAFRAAPKTGGVFGGGSVLFGLRFLCRAE